LTGPQRTLVVVPTYNERENVERFVRSLLDVDPGIELLVVDDASPDGTGRILDRLAQESTRVHVLHREGKQGLGTAYVAGFQIALAGEYDAIVQMDADFSHRPEDLPKLLAALRFADVAVGSRYVHGGQVTGWTPLRHLISRGGSLYARTLLDLPLRDCTSGFKAFRRAALAQLCLSSVHASGFAFNVEVNCLSHRAGLHVAEVPITFPDRAAGCSKLSRSIVAEAAVLVWRMRSAARAISVPAPVPLPTAIPAGSHAAGGVLIAA
jgi:dolichol-phosphate mannosyltransferase